MCQWKDFFSDEKRSSKVYFGYNHELEMGTHIAIILLDTGADTDFLPIRGPSLITTVRGSQNSGKVSPVKL